MTLFASSTKTSIVNIVGSMATDTGFGGFQGAILPVAVTAITAEVFMCTI